MSVLPEGWEGTTIGEVTTDYETTDPRKEPDKLFKYIDIGSIDNQTQTVREPKDFRGAEAPSRARRIVKTGDVLFSTVRTYLRNIAQVPPKMHHHLTSTGIAVLRPSDAVDPGFLFKWINNSTFIDAISTSQTGALYPAVKDTQVKDGEIPLPPLAEQKRIVEKLDRLSARIRAAKDHLAKTQSLATRAKQATLAAAFRGELTADWRAENDLTGCAATEVSAAMSRKTGKLKVRGKREALDELKLSELPNSWTWTSNYQLAEDNSSAICAGPFGTIFKAKDFRDEGVPIIFLRHVGAGEYKTHKPGFMDPAVWKEFHQPYSVIGGELLVTKLGDPPGVACIYPQDIGTAMVTPDVMKMNVDQSVASAEYLMYFFNSPIALGVVKELAFGMTRLRIDLSLFKAFPIPLATFAEQTEIVHRIENAFARIDKMVKEATRAADLLERLQQQLLAKAFRGELVAQDPNDEPASVLLERIREARA